MIELSSRTWVRTIWQYEFDGGNFMGAMLKEADGVWRIRWRFRYYRDDKAFESKDVKHWYKVDVKPADIQEAFEIFHKVARKTSEAAGSKLQFIELECRGDDEKVRTVLARTPSMQMHTVKD